MIIRCNGEVGLCCIDNMSQFTLGNINDNSVAEIWNNDNFNRIRKLMLNGKKNEIKLCRGCTNW